VRTLRAVRAYDKRPVPRETIGRIVEAGRLTASSINLQPWRFIVTEDPSILRALGAAIQSGPYVADAPLAIAVAVEKKSPYAVSDGSRAIQSMLLVAWSEGIGSNWVGFGPMPKVSQILRIPAAYETLAVLPFGYPAAAPARGKKKRKPLGEIANRDAFGKPFA
jgi:nitroreductase